LGTGDWGMGTGDWGLGTGDWGLGTGDWGLMLIRFLMEMGKPKKKAKKINPPNVHHL